MSAKLALAIFAKAPVPGYAKTRLIPALGADAAAALQARLVRHTVQTVAMCVDESVHQIQPRLWCAPSISAQVFVELGQAFNIPLSLQVPGDLGQRMLAACEAHAGPILIIGTDCPALSCAHVDAAAAALHAGDDAVLIPAQDGGYVLIGLQRADPAVFRDIAWGSDQVLAQTRERLSELGWRWREFAPLWDVDRPDDLPRLHAEFSALR
jgi:uncharacterized protein